MGAIDVKIWTDPKTSLPLRIEETVARKGSENPDVKIVMSDFRIGMHLDESLFRLEVPDGYAVQQGPQLNLAKKPIQYLADTLKFAAENNDGMFPETFRGDKGIDGILQRATQKLAVKHANDSAALAKLAGELGAKLGGTFGFLFSLSADNDWHYAGKDVKLNTPDRPIFWFRASKTSKSYQVLYADLSVKEVPSGAVPKIPASQSSLTQ